jgi:hypothetical protein
MALRSRIGDGSLRHVVTSWQRKGHIIQTNDLLADAFERIRQGVHRITDGCQDEDLTYRPDAEANSIAWLLWHLIRVMDDHVSEVAGTEQVWIAADWVSRFGLPLPESDTGYGHSSDQVAAVAAPAELLVGYHDDVQAMVTEAVAALDAGDLDRIIDRRWDPPVTVGVRLVSVIIDCVAHLGQADYVLGLSQRR